jgi:hypothetical protein
VAARRFAYWQDELIAAIAARDAKRIDACTRSLEKYAAMIWQATAVQERGMDHQVQQNAQQHTHLPSGDEPLNR